MKQFVMLFAQRFGCLLLLAAICLAAPASGAESSDDTIQVYKAPGCACCNKWVDHLRAAGFQVEAHEARNLDAIRKQLGVPQKLAGCHTARIGGYVIEGHVPAAQIQRLLKEKSAVAGISVPGMPIGSPGMEGPGGRDFDVVVWSKDGTSSVYATVKPVAR
jgi:hypothetical protein